jgi:uncharacterized membrane protein
LVAHDVRETTRSTARAAAQSGLGRSTRALGVVLVLVSAVAFSTKAVFAKLAYRHGIDPVALLTLRMAFSLPFFVVVAVLSGRAGRERLSRKDQLKIAALGVLGYYLASVLDFMGLVYISAGLERLILFVYPTLVVLLSAVLLGRPVLRYQVFALVLRYAGIALVAKTEMAAAGSNVPLGAALLCALVRRLSGRQRRADPAAWRGALHGAGHDRLEPGRFRAFLLEQRLAARLSGRGLRARFGSGHRVYGLAGLPAGRRHPPHRLAVGFDPGHGRSGVDDRARSFRARRSRERTPGRRHGARARRRDPGGPRLTRSRRPRAPIAAIVPLIVLRCLPLALCLTLLALWTRPAFAHPEPREPLRLVVSERGLELSVHSSLRALVASTGLTPSQGSFYAPADLTRAARAHADYLLAHLSVRADTRLLQGKIVGARLLEPLTRPVHRVADLDAFHVESLFYFPLAERPRWLSIEQNVLAGYEAKPGVPWRQEYLVTVQYAGEPKIVATGLVTYELGFDFEPRWALDGQPHASQPASVRALSYATSGLFHILSGWDHLLFVGALTLAARRLIDLVKIVAAFTVAHSVTLALAALGWLALPAWLVEPLIALSIVVVAVDNLVRPEQTGTRLRLATAFAFGLVHGLGFAGPLVEALSGIGGWPLATAIASFSAGVEVGHQLVVLPLFALVAWLGSKRPERGPRTALRYGSVVIALGGAVFLLQAVGTYVLGKSALG